jgi:sugar lactone lactonase YvrE
LRKVLLRPTFFALERNECAKTAHEEGQMDGLFRRGFARRVTVAVVALGAATAAVAFGATPASDVAVTNFATGFVSGQNIGPIGIAFDGAGDLFTVDRQHLYRFGTAGGVANAHVVSSPSGHLTGLAFGHAGQLYAARWTNGRLGDVVELDPGDGSVVRTVIAGLQCPTGLAVDPRSGDLFVSEVYCADQVLRISGGTATPYFTGVHADGLTFAPDGTLYVAHAPDANGYTISTVTGTGSAHPGTRTGIAKIADADGIALAKDDSVTGGPAFLVTNARDGDIVRIDLDSSHATRNLVTGGSRGDFVAAGPDGCLYATQTDSILKVTNPSGSCDDEDELPPGAGAGTGGRNDGSSGLGGGGGGLGSGLAPTSVASASSACPANRQVTVRYRPKWKPPFWRARARFARIFVKGHYNRRVSGKALFRGVKVRKLPVLPFRLTIRVRTRRGNHVVVARHFGRCAGKVYKKKK